VPGRMLRVAPERKTVEILGLAPRTGLSGPSISRSNVKLGNRQGGPWYPQAPFDIEVVRASEEARSKMGELAVRDPSAWKCTFTILACVVVALPSEASMTGEETRPRTTECKTCACDVPVLSALPPVNSCGPFEGPWTKTRPLNQGERAKVEQALALLEHLSPSAGSKIGTALGAMPVESRRRRGGQGRGRRSPCSAPPLELFSVEEWNLGSSQDTEKSAGIHHVAPDQIAVDFSVAETPLEVAITILHEHRHITNAHDAQGRGDSNHRDPTTSKVNIYQQWASANGMDLIPPDLEYPEWAVVAAACAHVRVQIAALKSLLDPLDRDVCSFCDDKNADDCCRKLMDLYEELDVSEDVPDPDQLYYAPAAICRRAHFMRMADPMFALDDPGGVAGDEWLEAAMEFDSLLDPIQCRCCHQLVEEEQRDE